jgi:hypothetical protein
VQVPANSNRPKSRLPPISPKFVMMAAAAMHAQGRLVKPNEVEVSTPASNTATDSIPSDSRPTL